MIHEWHVPARVATYSSRTSITSLETISLPGQVAIVDLMSGKGTRVLQICFLYVVQSSFSTPPLLAYKSDTRDCHLQKAGDRSHVRFKKPLQRDVAGSSSEATVYDKYMYDGFDPCGDY